MFNKWLKPSVLMALFTVLLAQLCMAGDIVNGRSAATSISEVRYQSVQIDFRLVSNLAGCGTPADSASYWRVILDATEIGRYRRTALLAAYMTGKRVQLRCEQSSITDFTVFD